MEIHQPFTGSANEYLLLTTLTDANSDMLQERIESGLTILWNLGGESCLTIDDVDYCLGEHQLIFLTEFHKIRTGSVSELRMVRFNRPFYCIIDHDSEVGCKGILFFGASSVPMVTIPPEELEKFEILWKMFLLEMTSRDKLQIEMLQMMLKRLVILCTRLIKEQGRGKELGTAQMDIVREFNFLVETHFRDKHSVTEYAELLHKSPKTLSNLFSRYSSKTPLQIIQERLLLEARRLLTYSDQAIKEIAYELGFDSIQTFSRFFKSKEGTSPKDYRNQQLPA